MSTHFNVNAYTVILGKCENILFYSNMIMSLCRRQGSNTNDCFSQCDRTWLVCKSQVLLIPAEHLWCDVKCRKKKIHRDSLSNDSGSILKISESIRSLVFNQMCDLENPYSACFRFLTHAYTTRTFRKIIFHKVLKGWSELEGHSRASLHRMHCERRELCLMLHLKCAVSLVCISLTNALRSPHLCGLKNILSKIVVMKLML